jgi:hypothetical protein
MNETICTKDQTERRIANAPGHYGWMVGGDEARFAVIRGARSLKEALAYLPGNYVLVESFMEADNESYPLSGSGKSKLVVIIGGTDNAGWTLDGYVIPRLASGLLWATEIV